MTDDVTAFVEPEENLLVFGGKLPEQDEMSRIDKLAVQPDARRTFEVYEKFGAADHIRIIGNIRDWRPQSN